MKNEEKILVRFDELTLKGGNKKNFIRTLRDNIKKRYSDYGLSSNIKISHDNILITYEDASPLYLELLKKVVGISWYAKIIEFTYAKKTLDDEINKALSQSNDWKTFRVSAKSRNKDLFTSSDQLTRSIATTILENSSLKVNLTNYDVEFNVVIDDKKMVRLFTTKHQGTKGLPSGSNGKGLSLLSGGIDSPVASYLTITRGINLSFITFLTMTTGTPQTMDKIKKLAATVNEYNGKNGFLYIVNFTRAQNMIAKFSYDEYRVVLLRRAFLKFSELISKEYKYEFLVTGDSVGQVASQTISALHCVSLATRNLIIRPLVSMRKETIIKYAKKIETYDTSILEGEDMCATFTPNSPIINPKLATVEKLEEKLENFSQLLVDVMKNDMIVVKLKNNGYSK